MIRNYKRDQQILSNKTSKPTSYEINYSSEQSKKVNPSGMGIANYCGPGTILIGQPSLSKTDSVCETHDYDYETISYKYNKNLITRNEAIRLTREADQKMLDSLDKFSEDKFYDKLVKTGSTAGIKLKIKLENLGILDPLKYSIDKNVQNYSEFNYNDPKLQDETHSIFDTSEEASVLNDQQLFTSSFFENVYDIQTSSLLTQ